MDRNLEVILQAIAKCQASAIREVEDAGGDPVEVFFKAVRQGDEDGVQRGISAGLVNRTGYGALHVCITQEDWTALHWAAREGQPKIMKMLLEAGARVEAQGCYGQTPLHEAALSSNPEVVKLLLEAGASVEAKQERGEMPLYWAVTAGRLETVRMLLEAGSKVDGGDYLGWTCPFRRAIMRGHVEIVELLLGAGAKVNGSDDLGRTPLHTAVQDDDGDPHPRIMAILLGAGANVNAINDGGRTPLHVAARLECPEIVQQLLDAGADPCIRDEEGQTAQDIALEREDEEVAEMLQGAEEEWTKPFILQVSAAGTELSFRTISGSLAATLTWSSERPTEELPAALLGALRSSGFETPFEPIRVSNLKLVLPGGKLLDMTQSVQEQVTEQSPAL